MEPEEKLRIKGGFGVTAAAKAIFGRSAEQLLQFSWPALVPSDAEAITKAWRITVDAGEKEFDCNNALSSALWQVEGHPWAIALSMKSLREFWLHKYYNYCAY